MATGPTVTTSAPRQSRLRPGAQAVNTKQPKERNHNDPGTRPHQALRRTSRRCRHIGGGADTRALLGGFFEVILALANIGTAVTLYPVVKRQNQSIALGYVCGRVLEAAVIAVGIVSVLAMVTLRKDLTGAAGTDNAALVTVARSLVAMHDWTFLIGPGLILGVNSVLLAYLMYRSQLVPRAIAVLGLVGGPLIFVSCTASMFGLYGQTSSWGLLAGLPVFAWEVSLAMFLIVKGFRSSPILAHDLPRVEVQGALATV